ncbi:MAG: hypothetical protein ACI9XB_002379 [Gammaproteobacteria bacterium]|jgi:hypothetical protein
MIQYLSQKLTPCAIILFSLLLQFQYSTAQCTNGSAWGGTVAPVDAVSAVVSNCNYAGEQAFVSLIQSGSDYVVTSSNCSDFITIYDEIGALVAFGQTPLSFTASSDGDYNLHFNLDESCATENTCRATKISCVSCGAIAGCIDEAATNYNEGATYSDCSCILPNLSNDNCAGAISLDDFINTDGTCSMTNTTTYSGATASLTEVAPSLECTDGVQTPSDVWFSLTVPSNGVVSFQFVSMPGFSSLVECYTGTCGALVPYAPVQCNNEEERTFSGLTAGSTVYLRVWDYGSNDLGNHEICVREETLGCTDPQAINYNPNATFDDGSCNFPSASKPCTSPVLSVNGPCTVGDNTGSVMEAGEPSPSCFSGDNYSVWYKFIAQSNSVSISTDFTGYTSGDTEVGLYSVGSCFNYSTYTLLACDQDGGASENYNSVISDIPTNIGSIYYIQVSGWNGTQGTFCLQATSPPANDNICGAENIGCGEVKTGNTALFSYSDSNMPLEGCGTVLSSTNAFYVYNGIGDDVNLSLCNSSFDTKLNVYCLTSGDCSGTPEFTCVGSNDDGGNCINVGTSEVSFATENGKKYYIMVHGYGSNTGDYNLALDCNTNVTVPANQDCNNTGTFCREMGTAQVLNFNTQCVPVNGTTLAAASIIKNPDCVASSFETYSSVWYLINSAQHSAFDITLEGIGVDDVRNTFHAACDGEPLFCDASTVYGLTENTNYYIRVFTPRTAEGDFTICAQPVEVCAFLANPVGNEVSINEVLEWSPTTSAEGYKLMIGSTSGSDDIMSTTDVGNTTTYDGITFNYNTTYYVSIIPYNDSGDINTCPGFTFTTQCPVISTDLTALLTNDCLGTADGGIDVTVAGGVGPYNFEWTGPNGYTNSTEDIVQVVAGEYTLMVSDSDNGCQMESNFVIPEGEPYTAEFNIVGQVCANDGSAEVVPTAGVAPFTYVWDNGATTAQISNMPAGSYEVEVTDANGCSTMFQDIVIENTGGIQSAISNVNGVGCGSTNGSITLSPQNGVAPYSYSWISLNGNTTGNTIDVEGAFEIDELPLGTYNITVTDVNGCNGLVNLVTVPVIGAIDLAVTMVEHVSCFNTVDGMLEVSANFGSPPFQFNWSNGLSQISQTNSSIIENIPGGMYAVTITDASGCVGTKSEIEVLEPGSLNLSITGVDEPACYGDLTGGIKTLVDGGVAPYAFLWSDGSTGADLINTTIGLYTVTVTDVNGCESQSLPINIASATEIGFNVSGQYELTCYNDNNGVINMNVYGGEPPYTFEWNNGVTSSNINGLTSGEYQCTIVDNKGCVKVTESYTINAPEEAILLEVNTINIASCPDMSDGAIDISVSGGTAPYIFNWSNGNSTEDMIGLLSGNYLVTITDANNCNIISAVYYVGEPEPMSGITVSTVELDEQQDGSATVEVSGGTTPYTYLWDEATGNQTASLATDLIAGTYSVTVTDVNGCMFVTTVEVGTETTPFVDATTEAGITVSRMELYPNPTTRDAQLLIELSEMTEIDIHIYDMTGKEIIGAQHYETKKLLTMIDLAGEADGVYMVKVNAGGVVRTMLLVKQQ